MNFDERQVNTVDFEDFEKITQCEYALIEVECSDIES
eukprot:UN17059